MKSSEKIKQIIKASQTENLDDMLNELLKEVTVLEENNKELGELVDEAYWIRPPRIIGQDTNIYRDLRIKRDALVTMEKI